MVKEEDVNAHKEANVTKLHKVNWVRTKDNIPPGC